MPAAPAPMATAAASPPPAARPALAWPSIAPAALTVAVLLTLTSSRYDYHRDELYFRMLRPDWGYVDQPPLTPLLARAAIALLGDTVWALRVPATLCVAGFVILTALTARELGGGRGAQALAAWGVAFGALPLAFGHILLTASVDLAVWAAVLLFLVRALLRDQPRWWLTAGAVVGVGLYNKQLIVLLLVGVGIGLLVTGRPGWTTLRSGWLWAGVGLALLIAAPNLIYQAAHGWPQLTMAGAISEHKGPEARVQLLPFQLLLLGPPLAPIWIAGLVRLLRGEAWRPVRALGWAYPAVLVIVFVAGGQMYYPLGLVAFLFAAGCVPAIAWTRSAGRRWLLGAAAASNALVSAVIALPLIPVGVLGQTPIPEINQSARDQVGWQAYAPQVERVHANLPAADGAVAVIITGNYGQAGALDRYGDPTLPAVYSGQNELWFYGPPPVTATVAVTVGLPLPYLAQRFEHCEAKATLDNGVGVANEEQGRIVAVCRGPRQAWPTLWPRFRHHS